MRRLSNLIIADEENKENENESYNARNSISINENSKNSYTFDISENEYVSK